MKDIALVKNFCEYELVINFSTVPGIIYWLDLSRITLWLISLTCCKNYETECVTKNLTGWFREWILDVLQELGTETELMFQCQRAILWREEGSYAIIFTIKELTYSHSLGTFLTVFVGCKTISKFGSLKMQTTYSFIIFCCECTRATFKLSGPKCKLHFWTFLFAVFNYWFFIDTLLFFVVPYCLFDPFSAFWIPVCLRLETNSGWNVLFFFFSEISSV